MSARPRAILLPGGVLPSDLAYGSLLDALGTEVEATTKELELYAQGEPPADYSLDVEVDGILRTADEAGFARFHLVGYSAGGAAALLCAATRPERLETLALLEPAWAGNEGLHPAELAVRREQERVVSLPPDEMMPAFMRSELAPGVEPPPRPHEPAPPWMASRPAGIRTLMRAFDACELDLDALRRLDRPVYYALGGLSNHDHYGLIADRLAGVFGDFRLEVFERRHHFDPPHRAEPERLAASLLDHWDGGGRT